MGSGAPGPLCFSPAPKIKQRWLWGSRQKDQAGLVVSEGLCLFTNGLLSRNNISLFCGMGYFRVFSVPGEDFSCSSSVEEASCLEQGQRNVITARCCLLHGLWKKVLPQNQGK